MFCELSFMWITKDTSIEKKAFSTRSDRKNTPSCYFLTFIIESQNNYFHDWYVKLRGCTCIILCYADKVVWSSSGSKSFPGDSSVYGESRSWGCYGNGQMLKSIDAWRNLFSKKVAPTTCNDQRSEWQPCRILTLFMHYDTVQFRLFEGRLDNQ